MDKQFSSDIERINAGLNLAIDKDNIKESTIDYLSNLEWENHSIKFHVRKVMCGNQVTNVKSVIVDETYVLESIKYLHDYINRCGIGNSRRWAIEKILDVLGRYAGSCVVADAAQKTVALIFNTSTDRNLTRDL